MKKHITLFTTLLVSNSFIATPAIAEKSIEDCQKASLVQETIDENSRCLDSVIDDTERKLQTWVNLHTFDLEEKALINGRHSALKMFKRSQSNFITFRENNCRWQYLAVSPAKGAGLAYKKCYILLTQSRINELEAINNPNS